MTKRTQVIWQALAFMLTSLAFSHTALAQSAVDNIRPVGQVCMAGQSCVGQPADGGSSSSSSSNSSSSAMASDATAAAQPEDPAPAPATPAPAAAQTASTASAAPAANSDFDPVAKYNMSCMACHATGAAGAPKIGDAAAWDEKMSKGWDAVMNNVMNGINAMPAKGMCMDCSQGDLRQIVEYMVAQSQ